MELKREQIIKALECCSSDEYICEQCPIDEKIKDDCECGKVVARNSLALVKELTEENERLENALIEQSAENVMLCGEVKHARADTVKKLTEMLTTFFANDETLEYTEVDAEYINECIDQIAKEMLEDL